MQIVILDSYAANPGDLSWDGIAKLGDLAVHARTPAADIIRRALSADILLTNKIQLSADTLAQLPNLKLIAVMATGVNIVDTAAARARGIPVCNVPAYSTDSVAQLVFALLLELCHRVGHHDQLVHAGEWARREWCFWDTPQVEVAGKTMGIVGFGTIGKRVGAIAHALNMSVLAHSRRGPASGSTPPWTPFAWAASIEEIFERSDVVSLHLPMTADNRGFVNAALLARMKKDAFLINTARGPLINDADLAASLHAGHLAGAGLDVATVEPINADNPLLAAPNCIFTPHYAWATLAARQRLLKTLEQNLAAFIAGKPQNVVN